MAIGTASGFKIYQDEFFAGMTETLEQETRVWNERTRNALRLVTQGSRGDFQKEAFFQQVGVAARRDTTSTAAATDVALTQEEEIRVKLNRRLGPVANTLDSFKKISQDPSVLSLVLGRQFAKAVQIDYVNSLLRAVTAAIRAQAAAVNDASAGTVTHTQLVNALAKFGDQASQIVAWVMHSKVAFNLMGQAIADKVDGVANITIIEGTVATLGRPVIVTDSAALLDTAPTPDVYLTLGLVENAGVVMESEERQIVSDTITGLENLVMRIQGEYAFNVGVKGYKWGSTANPADAALVTGANWTKVAADLKSTAGVMLITQ